MVNTALTVRVKKDYDAYSQCSKIIKTNWFIHSNWSGGGGFSRKKIYTEKKWLKSQFATDVDEMWWIWSEDE